MISGLNAQTFRITEAALDAVGRATIRYEAEMGYDYVLLQGTSPTTIISPVASQSGVSGASMFQVQLSPGGRETYFRIQQVAPALVTFSSSPANGETGVAVTRETILRFHQPLAEGTTIGNSQLWAELGGRRILSRVELSTDRKTATLFYLENLPSSARITVTFDGREIRDTRGQLVDADEDGQPGGMGRIVFETLSITPVSGTAIMGRVFASELAAGGTVNQPLEGVTITVDGAEETLRTTTDAMGNFRLDPCPAGRFFVHVDGRTAKGSRWPGGAYYPFVGKAWEAAPGRKDNLAGGNGEIYLPLIQAEALQPVSATENTVITFPVNVVAANPALAGVSITVPANSLFADNGTRGGRVGIAPVPPDRLPEPLPDGLQFPLVVTVQTDGASNFDRPVPVRFPNLPDPISGRKLLPGEKSALWSFNHDIGLWEIVGEMTVSNDGQYIETDLGVGIRQPGWHATFPGGDNHSCKPKRPNEQVNLWDLTKQAWDCAKDFLKIREGIQCLIELVTLLIDQAHFIKNVIDQVKASKNDVDACSIAKLALLEFEKTKEQIERLEVCYKAASPLSKAETAINCLKLLLTAAQDVCGRTDYQNPKGPCSPPYIVRLLCQGIDLVKALLDQAEGMLREINDLLKGLSENALEALIESLKLLLADVCPEQPINPANATLQTAVPASAKQRIITFLEDGVRNIETNRGLLERVTAFDIKLREIDLNVSLIGAAGNAVQAEGSQVFVAISIADAVFRRMSDREGAFSFILPSETPYSVFEYHPRFSMFGGTNGISARAGTSEPVVRPRLIEDSLLPDSDRDGLSDEAEFVVGTDPGNPDSDGDGIPDGAEIQNGTNPLDGRPAITGVIATAPTPGTAVDVCVSNDRAVTAEREAGVSIFNVFNAMEPVLVGRVDTPGSATAVACSGDLLAVADGEAGLQIIDLTSPAAAGIVRSLDLVHEGFAQAVAMLDRFAFVGTRTGVFKMVEADTGVVRQSLQYDGAVDDIVTHGGRVFVLANSVLHSLSIEHGFLEPLHSVTVIRQPADAFAVNRRRITAGNGHAYIANFSGYDVVDIARPDALRLVGSARSLGPNAFKFITDNGNGLGIAAVGLNPRDDGTHNIHLFDLTDPAQTDRFLTVLPTPGIAHSAALHNGLAYVADGAQGLQVVNYLAYDNKRLAPAGTLEILGTGLETATASSSFTAGGLLVMQANVRDDVQVRNVEFLADGAVLGTDGGSPFELTWRPPANLIGRTIELSARVTDTGGNSTNLPPRRVSIVADTLPPLVQLDAPPEALQRTVGDMLRFDLRAGDNVELSGVRFLVNGQPVPGYRSEPGYAEVPVPSSPGAHLLQIIATDRSGNTTTRALSFHVRLEAVSREFSLFNFGPSPAEKPEAISREFSIENKKPAATARTLRNGEALPAPSK